MKQKYLIGDVNINLLDLTSTHTQRYDSLLNNNGCCNSSGGRLCPLRISENAHNIIHVPGFGGNTRNLGDNPSPEEVWELLITKYLDEIMMWNNTKVTLMKENYNKKNCTSIEYLNVTYIELKAFIGSRAYSSKSLKQATSLLKVIHN